MRATLGALVLVSGCAGTQPATEGPPTGDPRVGAYVSSPWGFSTASYWIEGPDGLVLIDAQFLPSAAQQFVEQAEAATGKPARLAIVLHANPDKYNGVGVLARRGIRVVSAQPVVERMPVIDVERRASFAARYAPDYPERLVLPESFGPSTTTLRAAGLTLTAHVLGPGCSNAHVVIEWEGHVFAGDLVASRTHSWLKEADVDGWLARMDELRARHPRFVHPGRGPSGGPELLDDQTRYLEQVRSLVAASPPGLPRGEAEARIQQALVRAHPGYGYEVFLRIGVPAQLRRLSP